MIASKEWVKSLLSKLNIGKYSTSEIRIGTWIDGKPLYRKVIQTTIPATTATDDTVVTKTVATLNTSYSNIIKCELVNIKSTTSDNYYSFSANASYTFGTEIKGIHAWIEYVSANTSKIILSNNFVYSSNFPCYVVLEYTKS